jgi:hypothetical protein
MELTLLLALQECPPDIPNSIDFLGWQADYGHTIGRTNAVVRRGARRVSALCAGDLGMSRETALAQLLNAHFSTTHS